MAISDYALISSLQAAEGIEAVYADCQRISTHLGFEHFLFGLRLPAPLDAPCQLILSGYPAAWRRRYDACNYMAIDPILATAQAQLAPVVWADVPRTEPVQERMFQEAAEHGLGHGITFPVHGQSGEFSLLSLAGETPLPNEAEARFELCRRAQSFAMQIHDSLRRINRQAAQTLRGELRPVLTERERQVLTLAAEGQHGADIAQQLGISERTVTYHVEQCQRKLGVRTRSHAVARAMALGAIAMTCYPEQLAGSQRLLEPDEA